MDRLARFVLTLLLCKVGPPEMAKPTANGMGAKPGMPLSGELSSSNVGFCTAAAGYLRGDNSNLLGTAGVARVQDGDRARQALP